MNIRDLMVGDFVHSKLHDVDTFIIDIEGRVPKDQPELEYTEAVSVWLDSRQCWEKHYLDEIEPIPLTCEILEKNGFRVVFESELYVCYFQDIGRFHVDIKVNKVGIFQKLSMCDGFGNKVTIIECRFVQELQHAMKICGVEMNLKL